MSVQSSNARASRSWAVSDAFYELCLSPFYAHGHPVPLYVVHISGWRHVIKVFEQCVCMRCVFRNTYNVTVFSDISRSHIRKNVAICSQGLVRFRSPIKM